MKFKWYTDGQTSLKLREADPVPEGFKPGRIFNSNPWNRGLTKDTDSRIKASSSSFKKGHLAWNEGLTKETNETLALVAKKVSLKNAGKAAWNLGIPMTDSAKEKLSKSHLGKPSSKKGLTKETCPSLMRASLKLQGHPVSKETIQKGWETKRSKNSHTRSKMEDDYYLGLCAQYGSENVFRNYSKDPRYPFPVDFYITTEDLFIELNLYWTHGNHPFNEASLEDQQVLQKWIQKASESPQYKAGIQTWTVKDVLKLRTMKENNLNFKVIYPKFTVASI